jgi:hypothetical protein
MPQSLDEFVRGTPWQRELERLRVIELSAQQFLERWDESTAVRVIGAVDDAVEQLRKAVG